MTKMYEVPGWETVSRVKASPELPILAEVDVLVAGAGAAGMAAATVSAEMGLDTLLIEKYGFAGGAAVAGLSGTICGLYAGVEHPSDEVPRQLVHGFAERFRKGLADRGGVTSPQVYGQTHTVTHDPHVWREVADGFLTESGVKTLFHTQIVSTIVEGDEIRGAVIMSKAGLSTILARRVIDASGDAVVTSRAGLGTTMGENGTVQTPTMIFRLGNVDVEEFTKFWGADTISPPEVTEMIDQAAQREGLLLPRNKIWIFPTSRPNELLVNATRISGADNRSLNPVDPLDFTEAEIMGRRQVRDYASFVVSEIPGCSEAFLNDTGVEVGIRQTRSIRGAKTLTNDDVVNMRKSDSGIVRSAWPIELHSGTKPKLHWLVDDYYEIPYECLVPEVGENLIVAGRCLSAEHEALASARVTAQCFEMGQAAALATSISLSTGKPYRKIDGAEVRAQMTEHGSSI